MQELVPIICGMVLGPATLALSSGRPRLAVRLGAALVIGVAWSTIVGEGGALFAAWDAAQALGAALLGAIAAQRVLSARAARAPRP